MNGYLDTSDVSLTTIKVTNIPYRKYDVIVYKDGDSDDGSRSGTYTANGQIRRAVRDTTNWPIIAGGGTFSEAPAGGSGGNFIVFRNLSGGTLNLTGTPSSPAAFRAPINGIQIISAFDTDLDGMPDAFEDQFGFNSASPADAAQDLDSDGLSNLTEYLANTSPTLPDTDSDGILDLHETNTGTYLSPTNTGTNPLDPDTDLDTLLDGAETNSNPNLPDTDGDGYSDGVETSFGTNPSSAASNSPE